MIKTPYKAHYSKKHTDMIRNLFTAVCILVSGFVPLAVQSQNFAREFIENQKDKKCIYCMINSDKNLSGFEFLIGIPATLGGAIYMNAGAHGQCIADVLVSCCLFDKETKEVVFKQKSEMDFSYRHSISTCLKIVPVS